MAAQTRISELTVVTAITGAGASALMATAVSLGLFSAGIDRLLALFGPSVLVAGCATLAGYRALLLRDPRSRRAWSVVAVGIVLYAIAGLVWATDQVGSLVGARTPIAVQVLMVCSYVCFGVAMLSAARHHSGRNAVMSSALAVALAVLGVGALVTRYVVMPALQFAGTSSLQQSPDAVLVYVSMLLLLAPSGYLVLVLLRDTERPAQLPWLIAASAAAMLFVADVGWFWQHATGGWIPGSLVDFARMLANVLMLVAVSFAVDCEAPSVAAPSVSRPRA